METERDVSFGNHLGQEVEVEEEEEVSDGG
jgi:hypothetical protein